MTALLENIRHLSVAERLQLLEDIWDGILEDDAVPPLSDAQRAEIDRRLEAYDANLSTGRPWSEVREAEQDLNRSANLVRSSRSRTHGRFHACFGCVFRHH
jgi:putative addiction module component (TIGR02574 family)